MYDSTPLASLWGKEILKKWRCVKMYASRHDGMESSICRSRNTGVTDPVHRGFLVPVHDRFRFLSVLNSDCLFLVFFSILVSKNFTFQKYILPTKSQIVRLLQKLLGWEIFSFFLSFFLLFSSLLFSSLLFSSLLSLSLFLSFFLPPSLCIVFHLYSCLVFHKPLFLSPYSSLGSVENWLCCCCSKGSWPSPWNPLVFLDHVDVLHLPVLWSAYQHSNWTWISAYTSGLASFGMVGAWQPFLITLGPHHCLIPTEPLPHFPSCPWPSKPHARPGGSQSSCFHLLLLRSETFWVLSSAQANEEHYRKAKPCSPS